MNAENYLYFADALTTDGGGFVVPVSRVTGCDAASATETKIRFKDIDNSNAHSHVVLTHANISADADIHKEVITRFHKAIANPAKGKLIVIADDVNSVYANEFAGKVDGVSVVTTGA
jgi:hypothetical protein|tara:strand:- start:259 stop:609 length:351 start_codon:yes stop_codon:yes gene_type:complete